MAFKLLDKEMSYFRNDSPLFYNHPDTGVLDQMTAPSLGGLFRGTITNVNPKDFTFTVLKDGGGELPLRGMLGYAYCHAGSGSGILAIPLKGSKVIYQEVHYLGKAYANIISYITGDIATTDFGSANVPQNPGFEVFKESFGQPPVDTKDQGFVPGDMGMFGANGNKVKVMNDGSVVMRSTSYNFLHFVPIDNKMYQWYQNAMVRSPGSYHGTFNALASKIDKTSAFHYHIRRHFVNPVIQDIAFQEEIGLVDSMLRATSGGFSEVPNPTVAKPAAVSAVSADSAAKQIMQGYSVYRRRVFDFGGRGLTKVDTSATNEFFCEEVKSDGAYRVRVGSKNNASTKAASAVEVYYKPDGTWSVGSQFGRITCDSVRGLVLSDGVNEISLRDLITYNMQHTHNATSPGTPVAPPIATPTVPGLSTSYIKTPSIDPNLVWGTDIV